MSDEEGSSAKAEPVEFSKAQLTEVITSRSPSGNGTAPHSSGVATSLLWDIKHIHNGRS